MATDRGRKGRAKALLVNVGVLLATTIIMLMFIEIILSVFFPVPHYGVQEGMLQTRADYDYGFTPEYDGQHISVDFISHVSTNDLGLRDMPDLEYSSTKTTILFLGDSVTEGYGVDNNESIPRFFERSLDSDRFRVINAAVRGYATRQEVGYLLNEGYKFSPDYVVLIITNNDIKGNDDKVAIYKGMHFFNTEMTSRQKLLTNMFLSLRKTQTFRLLYYELFMNQRRTDYQQLDMADRKTAQDDELYNLFASYMREFSRECNARGYECVVVLQPWLKAYQDTGSYNLSSGNIAIKDRIKAVLEQEQLQYIDLEQDMKNLQKEHELYFRKQDGHFTVQGNMLMAQLIAEHLFINGSSVP